MDNTFVIVPKFHTPTFEIISAVYNNTVPKKRNTSTSGYTNFSTHPKKLLRLHNRIDDQGRTWVRRHRPTNDVGASVSPTRKTTSAVTTSRIAAWNPSMTYARVVSSPG